MPGSSPGMTTEWGRAPSPCPVNLHAILHLLERAKPFGVAEIRKTPVIRMRTEHTAGVLDRAPVDLGARRHLTRERDRTIGVGAIGATDFLMMLR